MSDFSLPDYTVPQLQATDLMVPDFTLPDTNLPDPPLPALMQPAIPPELDVLAGSASPVLDADHPTDGYPLALPDMQDVQDAQDALDMSGEPDESGVPAMIMPGTLDSVGLAVVLDGPDNRQLPSDLAYNALNSTPDMTTRERHLGMLLLGLEGKVPGAGAEGTGQ